MSFALRAAVPADAPRIAEILSQIDPDPVTADEVVEWERNFPAGGVQHRLVAVGPEGHVVGWGIVTRSPNARAGKYRQFVVSDPALRLRGIGSLLAEATERFAREQGATLLETDVRDNEPESISFAEHRGFGRTSHLFESLLDLATFDPARFSGAVEATGLRFCTMADLPDLAEAEQQLYAIYAATIPDQPGYDAAHFPDFAAWRQRVLGASSLRLDCIWVAIDGGRFVGLTKTGWKAPTRTMYTDFTGVHPEYRGRGIALALKLLSVETARRYGALYMRTNNSEKNAPMLAVNRKMGYQDQPGVFFMQKEL